MGLIYGSSSARITLYTAGTAALRITLQCPDPEGLQLTFQSESQVHQLGSGAGYAKVFLDDGLRPVLGMKWAYGLTCLQESWNGTGWTSAQTIDTAQALLNILNSAFLEPCLVEPHLDHPFQFLAQPDPGKSFDIQDIKGIAHTGLSLDLMATFTTDLPSWVTL
jgi:hypothetical protein